MKLPLFLALFFLFVGCLSSPIHPIKTTETALAKLFHPTPRAESSKPGAALPGASFHPGALGSVIPPTAKTTMTNVIAEISSSAPPEVVLSSIKWLYIAAVVCALACGIAFATGHILAAVKFAFAGVAGVVLGKTVSVVVGSFVLTAFGCFAAGLVVAWYILSKKTAGSTGFDLGAWIAAQEQQAVQNALQLAQKINPPKT